MSQLITAQPWGSNNSGRRYTGHIAVGNQADVNGTGQVNSILQDLFGVGTASSVLSLQETMTGTPTTYSTGLQVKTVVDFSSAATSVFGAEIMGATLTGNAQGVTLLGGFFGGARHSGSGTVFNTYGLAGLATNSAGGTVSNAYGVYGLVQNSATGTTTGAFSFYAANNANGGGTLSSSYGLYLETQTGGTSNYNMYSAGGSASNYFEGYVRTSATGGFYMNAVGSLNNRFKINEPTAANAAAECIITPSSTARIPMVYQGLNGQSANLNQWEDYTGAVMAYVSSTGALVASALAVGTTPSGGYALTSASPTLITSTSAIGYEVRIYGNAGQNVFARANGTAGSPTAVLTGEGLGSFSFRGWNGSAFTGSKAFIAALANENWSTTANGTQLVIQTTPNGSTTMATVAAFISDRITLTDGVNIAVSGTTGTKIGIATTQKLGFWNATPVVQPSAYTQTYSTASKTHPNATAATLTDNTAGTADTTLEALTSGTIYATDVAAIRNNFADLAAMVNKDTADILDLKKVVNQIIDDLQSVGILS